MKQFILGILTGAVLFYLISFIIRHPSTKNSITRQASSSEIQHPPTVAQIVNMSAIEKEAMKQEIINKIRAQMDICKPSPTCEEKKSNSMEPALQETQDVKIIRRNASQTIPKKDFESTISLFNCQEKIEYKKCFRKKYRAWLQQCNSRQVELVHSSKAEGIISPSRPFICSKSQKDIENHCIKKQCNEIN